MLPSYLHIKQQQGFNSIIITLFASIIALCSQSTYAIASLYSILQPFIFQAVNSSP
jgi:hypothetical protein